MSPVIVKASTLAWLVGAALAGVARAADPPGSWTGGAAKKTIMEFVPNTTKESWSGFVPPADRIVLPDNDGRVRSTDRRT